MENIIMSGKVEKWDYDWRVVEYSNPDERFLPVYIVERNQGDHDKRYFIVKLTLSKDFAISEANRLFANR